jgi:3-hydroxyisobutyrate dehydrogenase/glyoxylate/succinic semialdehyde reductase
MASNLLAGGHELTVYNRTASKGDALIAKGAVRAATPRQAAAGAQVLFTMLAAPDAVESCVAGKNGFLQVMESHSIWIDCSTVNPSFAKRMAEKARRRGVRYVDAPVAGSKVPAEHGELTFLVGAEEEEITDVRPLLDLMGKRIIYGGEVGKGSSLKMVINLLLGQAAVAFSEAMALGQALGIPQTLLLDTIIGGPATAPFITSKRKKVESGRFDAEFPLRHMHKDLMLASDSAQESGAILLLGNVAREAFSLAVKNGMGDEDFSAIYKLYNS